MAPNAVSSIPAHSKRKFLQDSDSDSDSGPDSQGQAFKVNEEYARRFEHNKKREEREKLEKKYGDEDDSSSSESDGTEDEDGFLATEDLDAQISATLKAIRTKDPRVYDKTVTFIELPDEADEKTAKGKREKPVFLRDYQREKLLGGDVGASDDEDEALPTYVQEQDALKKSILSEIHASRPDEESDSSDDDGFMKRKEPEDVGDDGLHPSRKASIKSSGLDVAGANNDPDTFLSNFMASRAWIPEEGTKWKVFESDDGESEADEAADEWEHAYNMRFEDPSKSNEVLRSYARDFASARSVRRQEKTGRQRQREAERWQKDEQGRRKAEEKARLRKLKLEENAEKLRKIKQAAGAVGKKLREEEWMRFLEEAWDDEKWEEEMQKRFGDEYYALNDQVAATNDDDDDEVGANDDDVAQDAKKKKSKRGPKKPKWDDDIDIKDIIPDFDDEENGKAPMTLSDADNDEDETTTTTAITTTTNNNNNNNSNNYNSNSSSSNRPVKKRKTSSPDNGKLGRHERNRLSSLVDTKLELTQHPLLVSAQQQQEEEEEEGKEEGAKGAKGARVAPFRYRETSPQAFGMTPLDILLAPSDQSLNQFVSLKKLAPFRDPAKKRRDRRQLAKRARLRQWRKDVFGRRGPPTVLDAAGPSPPPPSTPSLTLHLQPPLDLDPTLVGDSAEAKGEGEGKGKRKRKRKRSAL